MKPSIALRILAVLAPLAASGAQDSTSVRISVASGGDVAPAAPFTRFEPGARVRIASRFSKEKITGTVAQTRADTLVIDTVDVQSETRMFFPNTILLQPYRQVTLPVAAVDSVEVSVGRSRLLGTIHAMKRGAIFFGILGAATLNSGNGSATLKNFLGGFATGAAFGAVVSVPIGFTRGAERWQSVSWRGVVPRRPVGRVQVTALKP